MATGYLRRDLPDGHADQLLRIAEELTEGAVDLRRDSCSADTATRYHAAIDANRLMLKLSDRIARMAKGERLPG